MASLDEAILQSLVVQPGWVESRVFPRLDGYPDPQVCWVWQGAQDEGYGRVGLPRVGGRHPIVGVHRLVWLTLRGPIEAGLVMDHDGPNGCHNRACANPAHLQPVTHQVNLAVTGSGFSALNAAKTYCPRGHLLSGDNLVDAALARGSRDCKECGRIRDDERASAIRCAAEVVGVSGAEFVRRHGKSKQTALSMIKEA